MPNEHGRDWVKPSELAAEAKCDTTTVWRAIKRGDLKASRARGGRILRIERKDADAWLQPVRPGR
jgi:hypothetical protein